MWQRENKNPLEWLLPVAFPFLIIIESYILEPRESTLGSLYVTGCVCACFKIAQALLVIKREISRKEHYGPKKHDRDSTNRLFMLLTFMKQPSKLPQEVTQTGVM